MKIINKFFIFINFCVLVFFSSVCYASGTTLTSTDSSSGSPTVNSEAAVLMDAKKVMFFMRKNSTKQMYPASTTKVMTAILTVEKCDLNADVTVSYWAVNAVPYSYSLGYITPGQVYTVEELLNITLIASANDAAFVLAEYIANLDNPDYVF